MKTKSEFSEWFKAQYGERPGGEAAATINDLERAVSDANRELERVQGVVDHRIRYDNMETAARYAWNAALNPKPKAWRKR